MVGRWPGRAAPAAAALACVAVGFLAGCGRGPAPPEADPAAGAPLDAIGPLRARSESVRTLRAGLELRWLDPGTGNQEGCSVSLSYERPARLRASARTAAFFTVFDLIAAEDRVWLDIPREKLTVSGAPSDPAWAGLPVSPRPLLVALLADPWAGADPVPDRLLREPGPDGSRASGDGWTVWFDDDLGLPLRYVQDDLEIHWSDWVVRWGTPWPHEIRIRSDAGELEVRLGRFLLDRNLRAEIFEFSPDPDREVITPERAKERWEQGLSPFQAEESGTL